MPMDRDAPPEQQQDSTTTPEPEPEIEPPRSKPRWFHAQGKSWALFSDQDDEKLESKFQQLGGVQWAFEIAEKARKEKEEQSKKQSERKDDERQKEEKEKEKEKEREKEKKEDKDEKPSQNSTNGASSDSTMDKIKNSVGEWVSDSVLPSISSTSTPGKSQSKKDEGNSSSSPTSKKADSESHPSKKKAKAEKVVVNHKLDPSEPDTSPARISKVAVFQDNLFEVDLESMSLYPVFWKGVVLKVIRSEWFYSSVSDGSYAPIDFNSNLSKDLESSFLNIKPWKKIYKDRTNGLIDEDGDGHTDDKDKMLAKRRLMIPLKPESKQKQEQENGQNRNEQQTEKQSQIEKKQETKNQDGDSYDDTEGGEVFFENEFRARIFTKDWRGRIMSALGGNLVIRGFQEAERLSKKKSNRSGFPSFPLPWNEEDDQESDAGEEEEEDAGEGASAKDGQGQSRAGKRAARKAGAAKVPKKPKAGGGDENDNEQESQDRDGGESSNLSFASKLFPSSDVLLKPGYAALRALGWSSEEAKEEQERREKQGATEEALKGEGRRTDKGKGQREQDVGDEGEGEEAEIEEDLKDSPPELCLCIHGIGQQLSEDFDALSFVYDVQKLRNLSTKQASDPSIRKISRGRRVQFLPICWRSGLSFDERPDTNDNYFTLDDVSNSAAIPMVRNIITKVILDVPFYLSGHRIKMINAVKKELNRIYRLFCKRNPDFEKSGGRVNLICHSLGSALAGDILSDQPTKVRPLYELSQEEAAKNDHLLFNVKDTFFIGSPYGFFCYLESVQLIARRGTFRTSPDNPEFENDATVDTVGKKGCLATETLYNVYNVCDPVAYQISPCCDSVYANMLNPVSISSAVSSILDSLGKPKLSVSKMFKSFGDHPFAAAGSFSESNSQALDRDREQTEEIFRNQQGSQEDQDESEEGARGEGNRKDGKKSESLERKLILERGSSLKKRQAQEAARELERRADGKRGEKSSKWDAYALARAERRFRALNPHGVLDFTIESTGFNAYIDAIGAHVSYWTSPTFSNFVLSQLFLRQDENREKSRSSTAGEEMISVVPELTDGKQKRPKAGDESKGERPENGTK